jgi:hypothetical protein
MCENEHLELTDELAYRDDLPRTHPLMEVRVAGVVFVLPRADSILIGGVALNLATGELSVPAAVEE